MKNDRDPVLAAAKLGILDKQHLAFFWCWEYYERTGEVPPGKIIAPGVLRDYGVELKERTAYLGTERLKEYLIQEQFDQTLRAEIALLDTENQGVSDDFCSDRCKNASSARRKVF